MELGAQNPHQNYHVDAKFKKKVFQECIGTFFFVLIILSVTDSRWTSAGPIGAPFWIGLALVFAIIMFTFNSPGYFNPAVLIGFAFNNPFKQPRQSTTSGDTEKRIINKTGLLIVPQFVGALLAYCVHYIYKYTSAPAETTPASPKKEFSWWTTFLCEFIGTFAFVFSILVISHNTGLPNYVKFFLIGLSLVLLISTLGFYSGGHFNPVVSTAVFLTKPKRRLSSNGMNWLWYVGAQAVGGIAAGCLFSFLKIT